MNQQDIGGGGGNGDSESESIKAYTAKGPQGQNILSDNISLKCITQVIQMMILRPEAG